MNLIWSAILIYCCIIIDSIVPISSDDYTNYVCDYSYQFPEMASLLADHYADNYVDDNFLEDEIVQFPNGVFSIRDYHNKWICFPPLVSVLAKNGLYTEIDRIVSRPNYYDPRYDHIEGIKYADDSDEIDNNQQSPNVVKSANKIDNHVPLSTTSVNNQINQPINTKSSIKITINPIDDEDLINDQFEHQLYPIINDDDDEQLEEDEEIVNHDNEENYDLSYFLALINPTNN